MKKVLTLIAGTALLMTMCGMSAFADERTYIEPSEPEKVTIAETKGDQEVVFANGTPITITERTDGEDGALIKWEGGSLTVGPNAHVFGGGHDHENTYKTTSITMEGGKVRNLIGGGLHKSQVETASVTLIDGEVVSVQGGGASSLFHNCGCDNGATWYAGDPKDSPCRVDVTEVAIAGGKVSSLVFGGGEGISFTETASVVVLDGDLSSAWVTAGGSNGYTGSGMVAVAGGKVNVVQSVNRGSMDEAALVVMGGEVNKLYVGGETGDTSVTGTIAQSVAAVTGGTVTELHPGTTGGVEITPETQGVEIGIAVAPNTVGNSDSLADAFGEDAVRAVYTATFYANNDTDPVEMPVVEGEPVDKPADPEKDGYTFKGWFTDEALTKAYDFETLATGDISLYAKWEKIPDTSTPSVPSTPGTSSTPDDSSETGNPETGSTTMIWVVLAAALAGAASVVMVKSRRVRSK